MKFRLTPTIQLSLAALFFGMAAFLSYRHFDSSWRSQFAGAKVFPALDPDAVAEISINAGKSHLTLAKVSGVWSVKELNGHPADVSKISKTITAAASMKTARQLDDISSRELKELGLEPSAPFGPVMLLSGAKGEHLAELTLGCGHFRGGAIPTSPQDEPDGRYCLAKGPNGSGVPLLSTSLFEWLDIKPAKWLQAPVFDMTKALSISIWTSKSGSWAISRKSLHDPFVFEDHSKGTPSPKAVGEIIGALSKPPVLDLAPEDIASEISLSETLTVSVVLDGGQTIDFTFGYGSSRAIMKCSAAGQPSKWTYETNPKFVRFLTAPPLPE